MKCGICGRISERCAHSNSCNRWWQDTSDTMLEALRVITGICCLEHAQDEAHKAIDAATGEAVQA